MSDWAGDLTIGMGWVYYDGPVGHTQFHQHYAVQICFPSSGPLHIETREKTQSVENESRGERLRRRGFKLSMSSKENCYDNAVAETFFKTAQAELIWRQQ